MRTNSGSGPSPEYVSYLLRLWRSTQNGKVVWRASLECPHSGEVQGFASLEALCAFLYARTGGSLPENERDTGERR